jgi:hypothetical protein
VSSLGLKPEWTDSTTRKPNQLIYGQFANNSFDAWWLRTNSGVDDQTKKGLHSIIILGTWSIWNHRNRYVFDGIQPSLNSVLVSVKDEFLQWSLAGARGISNLLAVETVNV